ncbi:MAG: tRNA lysidine(34) synthetase TilS [Bacilli bacterium]|nr:tRNA lysidine(34) synthetase TilS [Bacilli bacterium]
MKESIDYISTLNISNDYIIVGCSGGPDSMCLLDILTKNRYKVICAHVDHNIRKESKSEREFLQSYCNDRDIPFEYVELKKIKRANESYYRNKRYDFYKELAKKYNTRYISTAHHGDDLVETVLMRITRGSSFYGYRGFSKYYEEDGYIYIKPLIFYTKEDIADYLKKNKIPFVLDKTNMEDKYTRNRYRHHILPFLKKENARVNKNFLEFSEEIEEVENLLSKLVNDALDRNYKNGKIDLRAFSQENRVIQKKELEYVLKNIYRDEIDNFNKNYAIKILEMLEKEKNFRLSLPQNLQVIREYDELYFKEIDKEKSGFIIELETLTKLPNGDTIEIIKESSDNSNFTTRLNSETLSLPLYIRTRQKGDRISVKNMAGTKKIKEIFIDEKIPSSLRDTYPLVVDKEGKIVWIPGLRKSKFDNEKNQKYDIILKYTKKKGKNE